MDDLFYIAYIAVKTPIVMKYKEEEKVEEKVKCKSGKCSQNNN